MSFLFSSWERFCSDCGWLVVDNVPWIIHIAFAILMSPNLLFSRTTSRFQLPFPFHSRNLHLSQIITSGISEPLAWCHHKTHCFPRVRFKLSNGTISFVIHSSVVSSLSTAFFHANRLDAYPFTSPFSAIQDTKHISQTRIICCIQ